MSEIWKDFKVEHFVFEDRNAQIVYPKKVCELKNWTLKTEYCDAFPETEITLLENGFHALYLENKTRFATKEDCDAKDRFVKFVHEKFGLRDKCVLVGMSCGGAHAVNFAGYYPNDVLCMFIDAPVLNFMDFPGRLNDEVTEEVWEKEFIFAYEGVKRSDLLNFKYHPMNMANKLIENKIPVIMLYGTEDDLVLYSVNGQIFEEAYVNNKDLLKVIPRNNQGHHPHGLLYDNKELVDFIINNSK